jgi:hypothetical protein
VPTPLVDPATVVLADRVTDALNNGVFFMPAFALAETGRIHVARAFANGVEEMTTYDETGARVASTRIDALTPSSRAALAAGASFPVVLLPGGAGVLLQLTEDSAIDVSVPLAGDASVFDVVTDAVGESIYLLDASRVFTLPQRSIDATTVTATLGAGIAHAASMPGGGVVVAMNGADGVSLARVDAAGALDVSFGVDGFAALALPFDDFTAQRIAVRADGSFVVAGTRASASSIVVLRASPDGALDEDAVEEFVLAESTHGVTDVDVAPDDRVFLTGTIGERAFIAALDPDGLLRADDVLVSSSSFEPLTFFTVDCSATACAVAGTVNDRISLIARLE